MIPFYSRTSLPGPDVVQTVQEATPGSLATAYTEFVYDSEPRGPWEEESGNWGDCADNGSSVERDQSPGFGDSS